MRNKMKPENKADFQRIIRAAGYSMKGLKAAYINEPAFRQEIWCATILIPLALLLGNDIIEKLLLLSTVFLVLITELLNSAVEAVVDSFGSDFHELSGRAKDIGSAAVFMAMVLFAITWLLILIF
ncbi:prokaryotic diacylglycerol kinase [Actinobacillus ureae ATCC 25976]|uniref:Diacylglycerol kinase n=2 Tax=Actinobacillus ureae TaxID=723 RepID=E8KH46_9PAST|nr:prokaryotic diacylglycerol kinase [Actinobacillus ureae ATCC 25976]